MASDRTNAANIYEPQEFAAPCRWEDRSGALIRLLRPSEVAHVTMLCDWTWRGYEGCAARPWFRIATPHGHMDFCPDHIDPAIAMLPPDWIEGWAFREPLPVGEESDDLPF